MDRALFDVVDDCGVLWFRNLREGSLKRGFTKRCFCP